MIRIFARTVDHDKILKSKVFEVEEITEDKFYNIVSEICQDLDLSTPLVLKKHYDQICKFNHSVFLANEFVESVDFKNFIIEILDEEVEKSGKLPFYDDYA